MLQRQEAFFFDEPAPPPPAAPTHTARIVANSGGYNAPSNRGSIDTATYSTPAGKSVTIVHCRYVSQNTELNYALDSNPAAVQADFPTRIVATKLTGGEVTVEMTPQAGSLRAIRGGSGRLMRMDYDASTGTIASVFVDGQTIRVDLYYD